jgi:acetate kinase
MEFFGIKPDLNKNNERTPGIREINCDNAATKILIVPTNEELEIANQCLELLN